MVLGGQLEFTMTPTSYLRYVVVLLLAVTCGCASQRMASGQFQEPFEIRRRSVVASAVGSNLAGTRSLHGENGQWRIIHRHADTQTSKEAPR
jgi:hypothetical protein